ncbi:MAG TPA: phosphotransferase [Gemmatimonadales bacterium]
MTGAPGGPRAPLRAADWRFLLPLPRDRCFEHLVLLGASEGLAARLADLRLARRVSDAIPSEPSADAMVVLHRSPAEPAELVRGLAPGGALYWEVNRRSLRHLGSTPARLCSALLAVGLSPTGVYAVGPSVLRPRVYLPLDAGGALRWYVSTLYNPWTRWLSLAETALKMLTGLDAGRFGRIAPDLALTAAAGPGPAAPSMLELAIRPAETSHGKLRPLMLTSTHQETLSQRIVVLPFSPRGTQPVAVVKVSKSAALNATIEAERSTLAQVRRLLDPAMQRTIPAPMHLHRVGDLSVSTETYLPGESLQRASYRRGRSLEARLEELRLAAGWLAEFHRQTTSRRCRWDEPELSEYLLGPIERYRRCFGVTGREERLFAAAERYGREVTGAPLAIVLRKPDFFGSNVVRSGDTLSVVDWESSHPGPPLCDLLRFVVPWVDAVSRRGSGRTLENFRRLFFGSGRGDPLVRGVHAVIAEYMERLAVERSLFPVLLLYTWLERALHHAGKQQLQGDVPRDRRAGNRHVGRVEVLAEHAASLFGTPPLGSA